ncbi:unnamed protein product [Sphagnum compactum]
MVSVATEIEKELGELGETPYDPLREEKDEDVTGESSTDKQLSVLNETLIHFFKESGSRNGASVSSFGSTSRCKLCQAEDHTIVAYPKHNDTRPKCGKCGRGHRADNYDTYDLLLGLDFLMEIGAMVDVENGTIHVRHGPWADVEMLPVNGVNIVQHGETQPTFLVEHVKSLDKMFQQLQMEDLFEKGLSWKGRCSPGPNHPNNEGSSNENIIEFENETDEEDV